MKYTLYFYRNKNNLGPTFHHKVCQYTKWTVYFLYHMSLSLFIHNSNRKMHPYIFKSLLYLMLDLHCLFCSDKKKTRLSKTLACFGSRDGLEFRELRNQYLMFCDPCSFYSKLIISLLRPWNHYFDHRLISLKTLGIPWRINILSPLPTSSPH